MLIWKGTLASIRIEFSRLALSKTRTYQELLALKREFSPYNNDEAGMFLYGWNPDPKGDEVQGGKPWLWSDAAQ